MKVKLKQHLGEALYPYVGQDVAPYTSLTRHAEEQRSFDSPYNSWGTFFLSCVRRFALIWLCLHHVVPRDAPARASVSPESLFHMHGHPDQCHTKPFIIYDHLGPTL